MSSSRKSRAREGTWFDFWEGDDTPQPPRRSVVSIAAMMTVIAALVGVLVAMLVLPATLLVASAARETSNAYLELPSDVVEPPLPQRSVMLDDAGKVFASFHAYDRVPVTANRMAPILRAAAVASEDSRFYDHHGYDPRGIARALVSNSLTDSTQGASTITQQYVKNVLSLQAELGSTDPAALEGTKSSIDRKVRELRLAVAMDRKYTKDELLTRYLNIAYFGQGAYGVQAAAQRYFSRDAADLNAAQAATLVALLKNPNGYNPIDHPDRARERRNIVLSRMLTEDVITRPQYERATTAKLGVKVTRAKTGCAYSDFPHYCEQVLHLLRNDPAFGATEGDRAQLLAIGGLRIHTALNRARSAQADAAAKSTVPPTHTVATAVALVEPGTGHVSAIGSSKNYGAGSLDRTEIILATTPAFQPGSTFKTFTLAAALDAGLPISTRLPGGSTHTSRVFDNPSKGYYSNSAGSESNVTLQRATQMSMNTAYVQLLEKVGITDVARMANELGITTTAPEGPQAPGAREGSYTLGTASVSVVDMANAYATIAAGGVRCDATFITGVRTRGGAELNHPGGNCRRVMDEAAADSVAAILGTVISDGTGKPAAFGRPAAGKTGTTENLGAAWFAGFTPQYSSAVWVGDPRGPSHPLYNVLGYSRVYGGTLPATVWRKLMGSVHAGLPVQPLPQPDPSYVATSSGPLLEDFTAMTVTQARERLEANYKVRVKHVARTQAQNKGVVVGQSPAPGTSLHDVDGVVVLDVTR